jgi:hypothetical protein
VGAEGVAVGGGVDGPVGVVPEQAATSAADTPKAAKKAAKGGALMITAGTGR